MVVFQPPPSGILIILRLWVPSGLYDDKHAWNDAGDEIKHAYVRLLSESTPKTNKKSYKKRTKHRNVPGTQFYRRAYVDSLETRGTIYCKGKAKEIGHYHVAWKYNIQDVMALPLQRCTFWSNLSEILSVFWKRGNEPGEEPWIYIKISDSTLWPRRAPH